MSGRDTRVWHVNIRYNNRACPYRIYYGGLAYCEINGYTQDLPQCNKDLCPKIIQEEEEEE
jgi:hypothetical protein